MTDVVEIYRRRRKWRWRYKAAGNYKILADSGEAYESLDSLIVSLERVLNLSLPVDARLPHQSIRRDSDWSWLLVVIRR